MSPVDFARYVPPGVYVEDVSTPIVTLNGTPTTTVTLVGPARGYQLASEPVVLADGVDAVLRHTGVLADASPAPNLTVTTGTGTVLVEDDDYTLVRGTDPDDVTTITWVDTSTDVDDGETVTVSYAYTDQNYYSPQGFESYTDIEAVYGPALDATPGASVPVISALSLAARVAFENGASNIITLATEAVTGGHTQRQRFTEAYAKIESLKSATLIVPIYPGGSDAAAYTTLVPNLLNDLKVHCESSSDDGFVRMGFFGTDSNYNEVTSGADDLAAGVNSRRVVLAYPTKMAFNNDAAGQSIEIGGSYLAAALAGRLAFQEIRRGLTKTQVYSFIGIPQTVLNTMTPSAKNVLSAAGVCVVEPDTNNTITCRHGVTTKMDALTDREISIIRQGDALLQLVDQGLNDVDLIGDPIDADMTITVKATVTGVLENAIQSDIILGYGDVQVRQQTLPNGDPTAIEVQYSYAPFLPMNYITVQFQIDLTTGQIALDNTNQDVLT